jgi:uncharacterized protein
MPDRSFPSFWMYKDNRGEWRWTYHARNGEPIAVSSEGYVNRADCRHSIDLMRASAAHEVWVPSALSNTR